MKRTILLGIILATLLSSCRLPHKLTEVKSEKRNIEVWESENSSVRVSGNLRFSHPPSSWHNRAGWVTFRIRVISPDRKLTLGSKDVNINWHCSYSDLSIPVPIEENTLSNSLLKESNRNRFTVTGTITTKIWEKMFDLDKAPDTGEFRLDFPEIIYESDTIALPPLKFSKSPHWLYSSQN